MIYEILLSTTKRTEVVDITSRVEELVRGSGVKSGTLIMFVPHTTASVTISENYDPKVGLDITNSLSKLIPQKVPYAHTEGNADAHIKAALVGSTRTLFIEDGKVVFGTWQGIFFCEFDGPRKRRVLVKILRDEGE